ncbi:uncharacterized protein PFL1_05160 [Pseudozyma flocculosa PF-1]|uniref:Autophagy-related protein 16 domain-containing protein n=2 Tax=Pseudozyma flocculosa TaxID=84751 RepID=A0A5C3F6G3_9BASI|nr:uncharacterized protein PFL1_05160 [Pseudozyma flocculosa PF-1]EPQ27237.1 hypothetical protein PFL1_05160 [Pseudozyma flocculosa PF-1]SPO39606.1 uncharacterized protein PSFLO_05087 [Pseudozyma flocculosa]
MAAIGLGAPSTTSAGAGAPPWHRLIHLRLQERDSFEKQHDPVYRSYANLAAHARLLKQRNRSLLTASNLVNAQTPTKGQATAPSSSTSPSAAAAAAAAAAASSSTAAAAAASTSAGASGTNPVHLAYISSLEAQLTAHRDEIATLYKTQGQNAQRLLLMNESLREREDESRRQADEIARLTNEHDRLKRSADDLANAVGEKERGIQILQDEMVALSLELSQIESRNEDLKRDNASLLQRWLDKMNEEAEKMNEGTQWLEEVRRRKQQGLQSKPSLSSSQHDGGDGDGDGVQQGKTTTTTPVAAEAEGGDRAEPKQDA